MMTAYVLIFVPVYGERVESTNSSVTMVEQDRQQTNECPFWAWFIDNARPSQSRAQKDSFNHFSEKP
jgi:hypothetical protein